MKRLSVVVLALLSLAVLASAQTKAVRKGATNAADVKHTAIWSSGSGEVAIDGQGAVGLKGVGKITITGITSADFEELYEVEGFQVQQISEKIIVLEGSGSAWPKGVKSDTTTDDTEAPPVLVGPPVRTYVVHILAKGAFSEIQAAGNLTATLKGTGKLRTSVDGRRFGTKTTVWPKAKITIKPAGKSNEEG